MSEVIQAPLVSSIDRRSSLSPASQSIDDKNEIQKAYQAHKYAQQQLIYEQLAETPLTSPTKDRLARMAALVALQRILA